MKMEDLDEVARELEQLENLQDDLYLDDVGAENPDRALIFGREKKYFDLVAIRNGRNIMSRGRGRSKNKHKRGGINQGGIGKVPNDSGDLFDIDMDDLNMIDDWNLDENDGSHALEDFIREDGSGKKSSYRSRGVQGLAGFNKRGQYKRGAKASSSQRLFKAGKSVFPYEDPDFEEHQLVEDMFDIEGKSHHQQSRGSVSHSSWPRDPRDSGYTYQNQNPREERGRRNDDSLEQEDRRSPSVIIHRKDPRLTSRQLSDPSETRFAPARNDPRLALKQPDVPGSEVSDITYAPARKDPRLVPQQALAQRKEELDTSYELTRKDRLMSQGEKASQLKNDPRLSVGRQQQDLMRRGGFENRFGSIRKDPRLAAQLSELQRREGMNKSADKTSFEKASGVSASQNPNSALAPPGVEESNEGLDFKTSGEVKPTRRGPRSPSPLPPPSASGDHLSPGNRKRDRSPRRRSHRDRSLSPLHSRHDRSLSPLRHISHHERSGSISPRRRDHSLEWRHDRRSWSRDRHEHSSRRDRSPSPRSRRERSRLSREWSISPRRDRSLSPRRDRSLSDRRDRSLSPRGRHSPFSPPHRSSLSSSRDEPWRQSSPATGLPHQPHYPHIQPPQQSYEVMAPPNMYSEGSYSSSAPPGASYGGPSSSMGAPAGPGYHSNYQQYGYDNYYQQPAAPQPSYSGDFVSPAQPPVWTEGGMVYADMSQPPPVQMPSASGSVGTLTPSSGGASATASAGQATVDQKAEAAKKEAIKNELLQQKQTLAKQREEYVRKKTLITRELGLLRKQEEELLQENSRDNDRILKENNKLQLEIQNKLKAINNVIDMLTGIIGDKEEKHAGKGSHKDAAKTEKKKPRTPPETPPQSSSDSELEDDRRGADKLDSVSGAASSSLKDKKHTDDDKPVYNYVYYDPEMHWCRVCDVFPRTAKEYLNHLHSVEHKEQTLERKLVDMPWHKIQADQEVPHIVGAPKKRTPIRGLQFFISATAWYCKLCDVWIGDLHCASLHLKSKRHSENYAQFTEQNPHWETDWLADREKAYEHCSEERHRLKEEQDVLPTGVDRPSSSLASSDTKVFTGYSKDAFLDAKAAVKEDKTDQRLKRGRDQRKKMKKTCITALDEKVKKKKHQKSKFMSKKQSDSSGSSSSSSSSSSHSSSTEESSDFENEDKSKSIRVAMRKKVKGLPVQQISNEPLRVPFIKAPRSKWDSPEKMSDEKEEREREGREKTEREKINKEKSEWERLEAEHIERKERDRKSKKVGQKNSGSSCDDKLIKEWMSTSKDVSDGEKQILNSIKDRLRQKHEADKEREHERKRDEREKNYCDGKGYYEDRRDSRRNRRQSESPLSSSYKAKRLRGSDRSPDDRRERSRFERSEGSRKSPERFSKKSPSWQEFSNFKTDQKSKEEADVKFPDKRSETEKKIAAKLEAEDEEDEEESAESKFEKQTAESAAKLMKKGKKPAVMTIPKSKLPFIGRMPILKHFAKKKAPLSGKSDDGSKAGEEDKKLFPEDPMVQAQYNLELTNVEGKVQVSPQEPRKSRFDQKPQDAAGSDLLPMGPQLPPNLVVPTSLGDSETRGATVSLDSAKPDESQAINEVQDMDIDDDTSNSDVVHPVIETLPSVDIQSGEQSSAKKPLTEIPLPKDFQDALNILFPGPEGAGKKDDSLSFPSQSAVIQSGPKPATIPLNAPQMNQGQWPQDMAHSQMGGPPVMSSHGPPSHPMQGYGGSSQMMGGGGPPMMGPMHAVHGPPPPGMYGPPGMPGPGPPYGMHGPPGPMMGPPSMQGPPQPNMVHGPPMHSHQNESRPPLPPLPKETKNPMEMVSPKKEGRLKKSDVVGGMSADELAMLGIDEGDMAAQSF